jgi:hypothetical protein
VVIEVKNAAATQSRKVSAAEVNAWFGKSKKSKLGQGHYDEIAAYLNR